MSGAIAMMPGTGRKRLRLRDKASEQELRVARVLEITRSATLKDTPERDRAKGVRHGGGAPCWRGK
jgi:hypothetical protein